jgi:hypothetical protein
MAYDRQDFPTMRGLNKDMPALNVDSNHWNLMNNIRFKEGLISPVLGHTQVYNVNTVDEPMIGISTITDSNPLWFYQNKIGGLYRCGSSTNVDSVGSLTWTEDSSVCSLNQIIYFNNGTDVPKKIVSGNSAVVVANWPSGLKAKTLRPFKDYLFAMNLTESSVELPSSARWSTASEPNLEPDSWSVSDPAKQSGQVNLADTSGQIVEGLQLRDQFLIYKTDAVYAASYVGGVFVFNFKKVFNNKGALGSNCVQPFEGKHFVVGVDDIYIHDGVQAQSVSDGRVKDSFYGQLTGESSSKVFVAVNSREKEMWVCYPSSELKTSCNKALVWSWSDNEWHERDIPNCHSIANGIVQAPRDLTWEAQVDATGPITWDNAIGLYNGASYDPSSSGMLMFSEDNKLYNYATSTSFDGIPFEWVMSKDGQDAGTPTSMKFVYSITPLATGVDSSVKVRVGTRQVTGDGITWRPTQTFIVGKAFRSYNKAQGRYMDYQFTGDSSTTSKLKMTGFTVEGNLGGDK